MWPITVAFTLLPSALLLKHFLKHDRYPEPSGVVLKTFFWGFAITIPVVLLALGLTALFPVGGSPWVRGTADAFLGAAIPEELLKLAVLVRYCKRHDAFDEPMDGIVYGVTVSLGFATLENVLYVLSGGLTVAIMRSITAIPCHAALGVIMGYYCGHAWMTRGSARRKFLLAAFLVPMLLHGLYDAPLIAMSLMEDIDGATLGISLLTVLGVLTLEIVLAIKLHRRFIARQLRRS